MNKVDLIMALADSYGNHRMTDGHHDLPEDHPHTLKARAALLAAVQAHAAEVEALRADSDRLDWLTEQGKKTIFNWFARDSLVNRGYRLHQGRGIGSATPREAIDAAITAARAAQE